MRIDPARASLVACVLLLSASVWSSPAVADSAPKVINRIVAVVGDEPITLRALVLRSLPYKKRIQAGPAAERDAAMKALLPEVLDRMVSEALFARRADELHLTVPPDEIDRALKLMADANKMTVAELVSEAKRGDVSEGDLRAQARQQLLEYRVLLAEGVDMSSKDEAELGKRSKGYIEAIKRVVAVEVRL